MTFKEQEQFTKKNSDDLLTELSNYQGENLIREIVRLGIQNLMELERNEHIGVSKYECGESHLYNWYTAADERKLCPSGWHVATDKDWITMKIHGLLTLLILILCPFKRTMDNPRSP